jgi:regulator of protease activity HflC (stomatin/prohibitin superfamily)
MFYLIAIIALIILLVVAVVVFPFFLQWLAEEDILFTTVKEGAVKAITRGKSFERFIMSFAGYHLNDPTKSWYKPEYAEWEVLYHGKGNKDGFRENDSYYDDRSYLLKHLGLYSVGWPWAESVYVYQFEWNETYTEKETGKEEVLPRAEATDFIYVADFTYAIVTEEAETNDRLPTDELTLVTVAIRNPYRALFSGEDWMRRITAAINRHVRTFVGDKDFQDLISTKDWKEFSTPIILLSTRLPDDEDGEPPFGLQGRYGVEIRTADLQTIELSGEAKKKNQEAATMVYTAQQEAAATRLTGQAKADVTQMKGATEAEALRARLAVIKEHGEAGIALAGYDAVQESSKGPGNTIIWGNNPLALFAGMLKPNTKEGGEKS